MMKQFLGILCLLISISACSQSPRTYIPSTPVIADAPGCSFLRYDLSLDPANPARLSELGEVNSRIEYSATVGAALSDGLGDLLFLSGGSQHGAFGSGFLAGWNARSAGAGLPDFDVVTGISTGALQSTAAFLGRPEIATDGYSIDEEGEILLRYVKGSDLERGLPLRVVDSLVRKGAISDLVPLRSRLDKMLTHEVMRAVANKHENGGRLYVGATDFDTGNAIAFDLGEMAVRFSNAPDNAHRNLYKTCYIEALVASSIVPVAAKPVFIDNRMYIDGGVRFAVFAEDIGEQLELAAARRALAGASEDAEIRVYVILNGDGETETRCGARDRDRCIGPNGPKAPSATHEDWNFFTLAARSVSLLTNQVSVLSIDRALNLQRDSEADVYFVKLGQDTLATHRFDSEGFTDRLRQASPVDNLTCQEWREVDDRIDDPVEFHPRYMQCLISLGYKRGNLFDWDRKPPPPDSVSDNSLGLQPEETEHSTQLSESENEAE